MGIHRTLHVWPARASKPKPGELLRATRRLVEKKLVAGPCVLIVGTIDASPGFWLNDSAFVDGAWKEVSLHIGGIAPEQHRVVYAGSAVDDLLAAVAATPPDADACVVFAALDTRHKALGAAFEKKRFFTGTVLLVELRVAKSFVVYNAYGEGDERDYGEHQARRLFIVDAKSGPDSIRGTPLRPVLEEIFGKNPKEACTES